MCYWLIETGFKISLNETGRKKVKEIYASQCDSYVFIVLLSPVICVRRPTDILLVWPRDFLWFQRWSESIDGSDEKDFGKSSDSKRMVMSEILHRKRFYIRFDEGLVFECSGCLFTISRSCGVDPETIGSSSHRTTCLGSKMTRWVSIRLRFMARILWGSNLNRNLYIAQELLYFIFLTFSCNIFLPFALVTLRRERVK